MIESLIVRRKRADKHAVRSQRDIPAQCTLTRAMKWVGFSTARPSSGSASDGGHFGIVINAPDYPRFEEHLRDYYSRLLHVMSFKTMQSQLVYQNSPTLLFLETKSDRGGPQAVVLILE